MEYEADKSKDLESIAVCIPWIDNRHFKSHARDLQNIKAQEEARESENRLRVMFETMILSCYFFDEEGNLVDCNPCAVDLFGCENKQEFLDNFLNLSPEYQSDGSRSIEKTKELIKTTFETGKVFFFWDHIKKDGTPLPVEVTALRVAWKDRYRIVTYARDLSKEKAKENALEESENRLRIMLDTMAFPCLFFDSEGNVLECNQQTINLLGFKNKEEVLENFFMASPEYQSDGIQSKEKAKEIIKNTIETGKKITVRWDHKINNKAPLPVEVSMTRVKWKDEYRAIAYVRDMSKLVETEENLKRIQAIVVNSPSLSLFLDTNGNIEYMNPAVSGISGYSPEEIQRDGLSLIFSPENLELLSKEYMAAALQNQKVGFEMTIKTKNGRKPVLSFCIFATQMYDGSTGIALLGRDITELKQMQQDLAIAKEEAERALVHEVQYNKAKSDFLSRVSHELRTPMNAIIGMAGILQKNAGKDKPDPCCTKIMEATEHLLNLVNDILDMTGFDTGQFDFISEPFSFSNVINSVINSITQKASVKDQDFTAYIDSEIPDLVESDERRLKQILLNLLSNAIKFTQKNGKIELSAQIMESDGNECTIRFDIIDNGIGITPETLEQLGAVFEQADNSITREHGGLGLSLSLTKRIIDLMHGSLKVESKPGKGSHFICNVRFGIVHTQEKQKYPAQTNCKTDGNPADKLIIENLAGKRVLVVDDVEVNREILYAMLEETGVILDGAQDGYDAINLTRKNTYNLILMDLHMPVMDGFTTTKKIRSLDSAWVKTVPVISVSAENSLDLRSRCLEAGINDHLSKPVDVQTLLKTVTKWITN